MNIPELFKQELSYWKKQNIKLFGVVPIEESLPFYDIQATIDECCDKYWNVEKPCKLADKLNTTNLDRDKAKKVQYTYQLKLNPHNMCIDVYADYIHRKKQTQYKVCAIPTPCNDLSWIINKCHYVPRVTAVKDLYSLVGKLDDGNISGEGWKYNIEKDEFIITSKRVNIEPTVEDIFNKGLSYRSKCLLQSCIDEELTADTFKKALINLPHLENNSVFVYKFMRLEYFENIIFNGKKYAKPTTNVLLGINQIIASQNKKSTSTYEYLDGQIVAVHSKIEALENFRTVRNIYNTEGDFKPAFTYTDTIGIFDSFKTVTSGEAGRQRLLLDNVFVRHGMLYITEDGKHEKPFYEYYNKPQSKAKRIMMNAKLTSQSVPLEDEQDDISHRILARVGFCDLGGYSYADSIVISESFAKRLRTKGSKIFYIEKGTFQHKAFLHNDFKAMFGINPVIIEAYENITVEQVEEIDDIIRATITWEIPFRIGDKITNLHGAKGTVGLILPDDKMPILLNDVGNMKAGALEVIISGFSTARRVSLGQIFEAWALANDIKLDDGEDFAAKVIKKYQKEMNDFAEVSIVEYNGVQMRIPLGLNNIMRIHHHAFTHISQSGLRFGEMEILHLVANGCTAILQELDMRSTRTDCNSYELQETRELKPIENIKLEMYDNFKTLGYNLLLEKE